MLESLILHRLSNLVSQSQCHGTFLEKTARTPPSPPSPSHPVEMWQNYILVFYSQLFKRVLVCTWDSLLSRYVSLFRTTRKWLTMWWSAIQSAKTSSILFLNFWLSSHVFLWSVTFKTAALNRSHYMSYMIYSVAIVQAWLWATSVKSQIMTEEESQRAKLFLAEH